MKKALQMTLAGTLFTIEEDAFDRLRGYLDSIKSYFSAIADSQDVVDDIEARVAEQLLDATKAHGNVVTLSDVDAVIASMGSVEEITGGMTDGTGEAQEPNGKKEKAQDEQVSRRLYRNGDDMVIAGVASGMAAFAGIDALIMRVIFAVLTLITSGGFILIYIALALLVPKAVTGADKIRMRGGPVTLSSFKENFDEQVQNVRINGADIASRSALRRWTESVFRLFGRIIRVLLKVVIKLTGLALIVIPILVAVGLVLVATNLIFNIDSPLIGFSLSHVITGPLYYLLVIFGFLVLFIPALFVISLGASILSNKMQMGTKTAMTLGGLWIVAVVLAGTIGFRYVPDVRQRILSMPEYQEVTETVTLEDFDKLDLDGAGRITVVQGSQYQITVSGRQINVDSTEFSVEDDTLVVNHQPAEQSCLLCFNGGRVDITITMPVVESIEASGNVFVTSENITGESLSVNLNDASSANLVINTPRLEVDLDDAAHLTAEGTAGSMDLSQSGVTRFEGSDLTTDTAKVTTKDTARSDVRATASIEIDASDASRVTYDSPNPTVKRADAARVDSAYASQDAESAEDSES